MAAEVAALCCLVAAGIHLAVVQPHAVDWWAYGAFFLATAIGQAALALLVWRRQPPWLVLAGVAGNLAILGMYILSRTNGPPLGPHAGRPEPAGALDLICAVSELGAIIALVLLLPPVLGRRTLTALCAAGAAENKKKSSTTGATSPSRSSRRTRPMRRPAGQGPLDEFRDLVKALHRAGLEVILDVVYNHTAEGGAGGPTSASGGSPTTSTTSWGADRVDVTSTPAGTGNTLNATARSCAG